MDSFWIPGYYLTTYSCTAPVPAGPSSTRVPFPAAASVRWEIHSRRSRWWCSRVPETSSPSLRPRTLPTTWAKWFQSSSSSAAVRRRHRCRHSWRPHAGALVASVGSSAIRVLSSPAPKSRCIPQSVAELRPGTRKTLAYECSLWIGINNVLAICKCSH